jgi:cell division protein FtsB
MFKNSIGLFIVAAVILVLFLPSYTKLQDLRYRNQQYKKKMEELKKEQANLIDEERLLKDDPEYREKVIRQEMGVMKKGEVIYRVVPD